MNYQIDRNKLNNQKSNLRFCTYYQNNTNKEHISNSAYRGICYNKKTKRWHISITINRCVRYFGGVSNEKEAALCYDDLAKIYIGETAILNFPDTEQLIQPTQRQSNMINKTLLSYVISYNKTHYKSISYYTKLIHSELMLFHPLINKNIRRIE